MEVTMMNNLKPSTRFSPRLVTLAAIGSVVLLLLLLYDKELLHVGFLNPLYWHPYVLAAGYIGALALVAAALLFNRPGLLARSCMLTGSALALAFPLLLPFFYNNFQLYAQPAPGYEMQWVTQPGNRFTSAFKSAEREHEARGCTYTLYGWSAGNVLYYGSDCQLGFERYDPVRKDGSQLVWSVPNAVKNSSRVDRTVDSVGQGLAAGHSPEFSLFTEYPVPVLERATSSDGQWVAATIAEFYGPEDIVILRATD
jgi:hypothetical protein